MGVMATHQKSTRDSVLHNFIMTKSDVPMCLIVI